MPQLVSRQDFSRAVTWSSGSFQLSSVAGPAFGGALIAWAHHAGWAHPAAPVYAVDAAAALVCLTLMTFVRGRHVEAVKEKMTVRNLMVGFRFVFANRMLFIPERRCSKTNTHIRKFKILPVLPHRPEFQR